MYVHAALNTGTDAGLEIRLNLVLDDEHHRLEPGPPGIVDGVVQNHLPVAAHRVHLLQPAVAAAHACGHNDQYRLFHGGKTSFWQEARQMVNWMTQNAA